MQPQRQQNLKPRALLSTMIKSRTPVNDQTPHFMTQANGPPPNQGPMIAGGPPVSGPGGQQMKRGQMIMQRQMRPRQPPPQGQPQMNLPPQNQMQNPHPQMYQIHTNNQVMGQNVNVNVQNSMHHMPQQSQQQNYGGPPSNMVYANSIQMGNMDQQMINQGHPGINQSPYQQQQQVNQQMMMRNQQMHHQSGHHPGQQTMGPPQGQQQGAGQPVAQQQTHHPQQYLQGPGPGQMNMQGMQNMHW